MATYDKVPHVFPVEGSTASQSFRQACFLFSSIQAVMNESEFAVNDFNRNGMI